MFVCCIPLHNAVPPPYCPAMSSKKSLLPPDETRTNVVTMRRKTDLKRSRRIEKDERKAGGGEEATWSKLKTRNRSSQCKMKNQTVERRRGKRNKGKETLLSHCFTHSCDRTCLCIPPLLLPLTNTTSSCLTSSLPFYNPLGFSCSFFNACSVDSF